MKEIANNDLNIKDKIFTIRGVQVMLDRDLAELYGVMTGNLNKAVKRNIERFPEEFMFQLTKEEFGNLIFHFGISSWGGVRKLPFAFTEQGVAMLSSVLKSERAIKINIQIIKAFISMRRFIFQNVEIFNRFERIEHKQIQYDKNFDKIFKALEDKSIKPKQGIFFDGQIFDAYKFVCDLLRMATTQIILLDNYISEETLMLFSSCKNIEIIVYTKEISDKLRLDLRKYNSQYSPIEVRELKSSHDRFLIIDKKVVYHFGASLKDLGKKWFAFSRFETEAVDILKRLK